MKTCRVGRIVGVRSVFAVAVWLLVAAVSSAHFVFIESAAEGDRLLVRSGFGELDGWDPDLVGRMSNSTFQLRTTKGLKPLAMKVDDQEKEYRAAIEGEKPKAVLGVTDFGTIQFGTSPTSRLRYTAKHLVGDSKNWGEDKPTKDLRIELIAKLEGDKMKLRAIFLGKPLTGAKIKGATPSGNDFELLTDAKGQAELPVGELGHYAMYVGTTTEKTGEINGKEYDVLKDYTTLTFTIGK